MEKRSLGYNIPNRLAIHERGHEMETRFKKELFHSVICNIIPSLTTLYETIYD